LPLPGPRARRPRNLLFATNGASDRLPSLESVSQPANRGLAPPLVASYDLLSHLKTGERSFASPSADPQLASSLIPLKHDTSSYRLAQRYVGQGHLPAPEDVRIEDFLAAQCDHFPPTENKLVIRVAAGPSPLGEPGLRLLEVGVQAGRIASAARSATDLTIAVDTSASMRHGRRLEMVRAAIRRLVAELTPADHVTLIGFSDDAELLADRLQVDGRRLPGDSADRAATDRLLAAVDHLVPDNGTNVGAGIALAGDAILRAAAEPSSRRQFVLLSDGLAELGSDDGRQIGALLRSLTTAGVKFSVLDVSGEAETSGPLAELAAAGEGQAVRAADTDEMTVALTDALAGGPQTIAHSASLKVTFNPQVVHSYRLVGHATTTITGPASAATQVDLHAGAQAAGLFEIWLQPGGGDDVATAELTWHEPAGAGSQKLTQRISRLQFAKSFAESPLSLQAAVIASEAARALRSYTATPARSFARVLDLASGANPLLQESDSFRQLVALVGQAEKVRASGASIRRAGNSAKP
jgi:Ca-activated chloride channel family protein